MHQSVLRPWSAALIAAVCALLLIAFPILPLTQPAAAAAISPLSCTAGNVYSVSGGGQLRQISSSGTVSNVGSPASGVSLFNGLGIGSGGSDIYAYERNDGSNGSPAYASKASMYKFDLTSGTWTNLGATFDTSLKSNGAFMGNLVAGAVDLSDGSFVFGGFSRDAKTFKLFQYEPTTKKFSYLGYIDTSVNDNYDQRNGDIAFDSQGNLFVVRGTNGGTTIFSVTAANFQAASGGFIRSSATNQVTTLRSVNGVAFDSAGRGFLGNSDTVGGFTMPNWTNATKVTDGLSDSSDLASCSSPATFELRKNVVDRVNPTDQFTLSAKTGNTEIANTTTEGTANGVQSKVLGPFPVQRGTDITISEAGAGTTDLNNYTTTYSCTADGSPLSTTVNDSAGNASVTIPSSGQATVCVLTNTPKAASIQVDKKWVVDGTNYANGSQPKGISATLGLDPAGTGSGSPAFGQERTGLTAGSSAKISETTTIAPKLFPGCTLASAKISENGQSTSTDLGSPTTVKLTSGKNAYTVTNTVVCQNLTLTKSVENTHGGKRVASDWDGRLSAGSITFNSGQTQRVATGTYALTESQYSGYTQKRITCSGGTFDSAAKTIKLAAGQSASCTIINADSAGSVTWSKSNTSGNLLDGSSWTLKGPDGTTVTVDDCVASAASGCTGADQDPAAGKFSIQGLSWGDYTLTERKAPAGYVLDTKPRTFTVSDTALNASLGTITNEQAAAVALPLTGGRGAYLFGIAGGVLLAGAAVAGILVLMRKRRTL